MRKNSFNSEKYFEMTKKEILKRVKKFNNKLYLEIGGKLFDDHHASRVLPGFKYNSKIEILKSLASKAEIIMCISAGDIERNKIRADYGITYDKDVMRLIDKIRKNNLTINSVVITQYQNQPAADTLRKKLEMNGIRVYIHTFTKGYPSDVETIVSEEGYGANEYIKTSKPIVVVTAPGPGSGKLATCLTQMYHEYKKGVKAGYAKFETFPVWNLPLKHPINVAYEAATADLKDVNMIDPFHLEAYGITTVNYNRDVEVYPVLRAILKNITGKMIYKSPTDMGINMIGYCIDDDKAIQEASKNEIIRRYYKSAVECKQGEASEEEQHRITILMNELGIDPESKKLIKVADKKSIEKDAPIMAIELENGKIVTGKQTKIMTAPASMLMNAIKIMAKLDDDVHLIAPLVLEPMLKYKQHLYKRDEALNLQEVLLALNISAATNPIIDKVVKKLDELVGCDAHATYIISGTDEKVLRALGINFTCEPNFISDKLYLSE